MGFLDWGIDTALDLLEKAKSGRSGAQLVTAPLAAEPKSEFYDPLWYIDAGGWKENPSPVIYDWLRKVTMKDPIVAAIFQTRINQVASFARRPRNKYDLGTMVQMKESVDKPSKADEAEMRKLEQIIFVQGLGVRGSWEQFLKKFTRDLLTYDQGNFEVLMERNKSGKPAGFITVDASTMRIASKEKRDSGIDYVQLLNGTIVNEYKFQQMAWSMMNPRSDINCYGYGFSPLEMIIETITSHLWAEQYNRNAFRQGVMSKGIINLKSMELPKKQLEQFRMKWNQLVTGVDNAWRTPIFSSKEGIEYVKLSESNRDMEFNSWMDYLIKITCAVCLIDPVEINFYYGNTGQTSSLGNQDNESKLKWSKDRGLRPILRTIEDAIQRWVIEPRYGFESPFQVRFVGLDSEDRQAEFKRQIEEVQYKKMLDEIRAEDDLPPLEDGKGQIILNNVWLQNAQFIDSMNQQQQGGEFGQEGEDQSDQEQEAEPGAGVREGKDGLEAVDNTGKEGWAKLPNKSPGPKEEIAKSLNAGKAPEETEKQFPQVALEETVGLGLRYYDDIIGKMIQNIMGIVEGGER